MRDSKLLGGGVSEGQAPPSLALFYLCREHGRVKAYLNRYPVKGGFRFCRECSVCRRLNSKCYFLVNRAHVRAKRRERTERESGNEIFLAKRRTYYARNRAVICSRQRHRKALRKAA